MSHEISRAILREDSALLSSCESQSWIQARVLKRRWTKIKDREMEAAVQYLDEYTSAGATSPSTYVENPKASHEVFDGVWAHQEAGLQKESITRYDVPGVEQTLQEVFVIDSFEALEALNRRRDHEDTRKNEFDFQDGRADNISLDFPFLHSNSEAFCMGLVEGEDNDLSEADLLALAPDGYKFFSRVWSVDKEGHYATLSLVFKAVEWNEWGHDSFDFDYNSGRGIIGTPEFSRTLTWVNIRNEDVKKAIAQLLSHYASSPNEVVWAPDAGFTVTAANVSNHRNGSCDITATQTANPAGGVYLDSWEKLNPFGWDECQGWKYAIDLTFSGYADESSLKAATTGGNAPAVPAGYTATGFKETKAGDGTYGALFSYESVLWENGTTPNPLYDPDDPDSTESEFLAPTFHDTGTSDSEGNGYAKSKRACGIGKDQAPGALASIASDADFVLKNTGLAYKGRGEYTLSATQQSVYSEDGDDDAVVTRLTGAEGSLKGLQRTWYRRTAEATDTLTGKTLVEGGDDPDNPGETLSDYYTYGIARSDYTFDGSYMYHDSVVVTDNHDGSYNVTQTLSITGSSNSGGRSDDLEGEYLYSRQVDYFSKSGNVWRSMPTIVSVYAKLFSLDGDNTVDGEDETPPEDATDASEASEAAWVWAKKSEVPDGQMAGNDDGAMFDKKSGNAMTSATSAQVHYKGSGNWLALRTIYTTIG